MGGLMSGVIKCPNCKTPLFVAEEMIGQVMACPTCQRPIHFMGQSQPASAPAPPATIPPATIPPTTSGIAAGKARLPQAAPLAPAQPPLPSLEPAPAAPKYTAEASQFALQPVTSAPPPPKPRDETLSPVVLITWAVLGLLVVGSGVIVAVASFKGLSREPVATRPKSSVPPLPPSQRAITRPFSAPPLPAPEEKDPAVIAMHQSLPAAPISSERPRPAPQRAMPSVAPVAPPPSRSAGAPGSPIGIGSQTSLPIATNAASSSLPAARSPTQGATAANPPRVSAPSVSAPPPPAITGPLAGLDDAWRLPAPISTTEAPLGSLSEDPTEPVNLSLSSTAAAIGETAAFFVERIESGLWTVFYLADLKVPQTRVPLATLRLVGRQFSFAWKSQESPELRRQVANCRLTVHHGSQTRAIQLRAVQEEPAIKLDLEKATLVRELTIADLPKVELLRLEVTSLDGFAGNPNVIVKSLPLTKETKIEFADFPGAEIEIRFQKLSTGNLAVRLEPAFREGESKEFDLTLPRLKMFEDGVTQALRRAERELPAEKRELAAKQKALRNLNNSQPSNPLAVPAWKQTLNDLAGDVDRTSRKVARLTNDIPLHKARLAAVPKMRDFLTTMHQVATIRLRVVAECGDHDVVLVSATTDSQSGE